MIDSDMSERLVNEYTTSRGTYDDLVAAAVDLLKKLISESGVQLYSVTGRAKSIDSLKQKLTKPNREYGALGQVTDLAGVRVITYLVDDVGTVGQYIEREFDVDTTNSIDRGKALDPDRFGYASVHYVVRMKAARTALLEYKRFANVPFEIQVRSILQHAWAEIEHDLGYKTKESIPTEVQRRFSRLAGLLELADSEFDGIRTSLTQYREQVTRDVGAHKDVELNKDSLLALLNSDPHVRALDQLVAAEMKAALVQQPSDLLADRMVSWLRNAGLPTTQAVSAAADKYKGKVAALARTWLDGKTYETTGAGIGTFYLAYLLAASRGDVTVVSAFLDSNNIGESSKRRLMAERLVKIVASLS